MHKIHHLKYMYTYLSPLAATRPAYHIPEEYSELVTALEADLESLTIGKIKERIRAYCTMKVFSKARE